jgi:hypothetical protein
VVTERSEAAQAASALLERLVASSSELHRRVSWMSTAATAERLGGLPYGQMLPLQRRMQMVEELSRSLRALISSGQAFRRAEARALYAEGLTMAQLAAVLGVSRQRATAMVKMAETAPEPRRSGPRVADSEPGVPARCGYPQAAPHATG